MAKKVERKEKLLDVGCALGDCIHSAIKAGWRDVWGVEVSKFAYEFAKKRGFNVKNSTLEKSELPTEYFNLVTYQDVIEHVKDPVKELNVAYKFLKKGGWLYLVTPDFGGLWHKILGSYWYHYKPGEHVVYFSQNSLKQALLKAGYKSVETKTTYHVLSLEYVLNRLKYYSPFIFENLSKVISHTSLKNYAFRAYTGEIEAWGQK